MIIGVNSSEEIILFFTFRIRRKYSLMTAIIFGMYWSSILFQMASIYALTLDLLERKEIEISDVIK